MAPRAKPKKGKVEHPKIDPKMDSKGDSGEGRQGEEKGGEEGKEKEEKHENSGPAVSSGDGPGSNSEQTPRDFNSRTFPVELLEPYTVVLKHVIQNNTSNLSDSYIRFFA